MRDIGSQPSRKSARSPPADERQKDRQRSFNDESSKRRRRSFSRSRSRSRSRSNSRRRRSRRSRSNDSSGDEWIKLKAKRKAEREKAGGSKLWDVPPAEGAGAINPAGAAPPGVPELSLSVLQPLLLQTTIMGASPQQSRQARRLYVGNIPAAATEADIAQFFNFHLSNTGKCAYTPPVTGVQIHAGKAFAFVEFMRVEDATLCMALDGIVFDNQKVKVIYIVHFIIFCLWYPCNQKYRMADR